MARARTALARTIASSSPNDMPDSSEIMCNCCDRWTKLEEIRKKKQFQPNSIILAITEIRMDEILPVTVHRHEHQYPNMHHRIPI